MAHFAEIDQNNIVLRVLVVPDEQEHRGHDYLSERLGGTWVQTSYNNRIRKQFAGPGYTYDSTADVFIAPQPFQSWSLDANHDWQPPTPMPETGEWMWDEGSLAWVDAA